MKHEEETVTLRLRGRELELGWPKFLLFTGLAIILLLALETLVILLVAPWLVGPILRGVGAEVVTGREAGLAVFLEGEVPVLLAMQYSAMQDLAVSFIVFPVFLWLLKRYHDRDNMIMRHVRRVEEKAMENKDRVRRHGPVFLFLFMLIPFMVNGPLIGLMVGRLVRMRMQTLMGVVVLATLVPAIAWTMFYDTLFLFAERFLPVAPTHITIFVVSLVLVIIIVGSTYETIKDRKENNKEKKRKKIGSDQAP